MAAMDAKMAEVVAWSWMPKWLKGGGGYGRVEIPTPNYCGCSGLSRKQQLKQWPLIGGSHLCGMSGCMDWFIVG